MTPPSAFGAASFALLLVLAAAALADRLIWLHTGAPVLGSVNLDHFPEVRGLCPQGIWAEVKESRAPGLLAYRCDDVAWLAPFPTRGRSPELRRLWFARTNTPPPSA